MLKSKNVNNEVSKDSPSVKTRKNIGMPDGQLHAQIYTSAPTATCVARKRPVCRVWPVLTRAFFKKAFCADQNRSIIRGSIGLTKSFAPDFQGRRHDIFCQIYPNLSVLTLSTSLAYTFAFSSVW